MTQNTLPKEDSHNRIPIHVLTGFLGSGKTTLLNHLLKQAGMENTAVIVNEFGEIGIDHLLVKAATEDLVMLEGGCVCCSVRSDLVTTLEDLYQRRSRKEIPRFSQVAVETTGLADPTPILRTLLDDEFCAAYYRLDTVISTVDCLHAPEQLSEYDECVKQAALAQHIVLTKSKLVDAAVKEALLPRLRRLNPAARIHDADVKLPPALELLSTEHYSEGKLAPERWLQAEHYQYEGRTEKKPLPSHRTHDTYIKTFCIEYPEPLSWRVLERWIQQLRRLRGKDLLRVKGITYTLETDKPVLIQGIQHVFQAPVTLAEWPDDTRSSRIVFITRNIEKETVERSLHAIIESRTAQDFCAAAMHLLQHPS